MESPAEKTDSRTVLVVDDNLDVLDLFGLILHDAGYRVATATDGERGVELACELEPEIILLDMMLPKLDGIEFLKRLQARPPQRKPAVLAISGFELFREQALALGAKLLLLKPVEPSAVLATIAAVMQNAPLSPETLRGADQRPSDREMIFL